jgi:alcohol dehydrogenase
VVNPPLHSIAPIASFASANGTFQFHAGTRLVVGAGAIERLGGLAAELGGRFALVVSDPGITAAGHVARAVKSLEQAGLRCTVFDSVHENPTTVDVDACVRHARGRDIDLLIGLGGGSPMDAAKGCNFLLTNGGRMQEYWGRGKARGPMLPMIAVPTTAGTGSEVQSFALVADADTHQKMACGDPKALPRVALLDPTLTLSQPHAVSACSGLDALAHALESAVTSARTPLSRMLSAEAFGLAAAAFPQVLERPQDLSAQESMLLSASLAGMAIENSMLGAAHSMANPLTAGFDLAHGHAVALMLPHVIRFNAALPEVDAEYARLVRRLEGPAAGGGETLARWLEAMLQRAGLPRRLRECGVGDASIPELARGAARQWTAQFNPRPVSASDFEALYRAAC